MTFYARAGRGGPTTVAHIIDGLGSGMAWWMCGATGQDPVVLGPSPSPLPVCQNCDGAVLGPVVYRYFDADGRCLYIGSTQNISARVAGHRQQPWWPHVDRLTVESYPSLRLARLAEVEAIRTEQSLHNRQHFRAA